MSEYGPTPEVRRFVILAGGVIPSPTLSRPSRLTPWLSAIRVFMREWYYVVDE